MEGNEDEGHAIESAWCMSVCNCNVVERVRVGSVQLIDVVCPSGFVMDGWGGFCKLIAIKHGAHSWAANE